jgi:hypothetical protein
VVWFLLNLFQENTSSVSIMVFLDSGVIAYAPLSPVGPSMSMPSVLPSFEKEWQFPQVGIAFKTTLLEGFERSLSRHCIKGNACAARGLMMPSTFFEGIKGTSR